ncbi:hypothetical protein QFC19_006792 [Naganishia cerealis]|uniref:Uncharacterized protein n=1 Tax=Naganishia cerealis TaxID=610337 RepID=A0ACC2VEQ8_9TREE|nr:hypothetical protein QFC19_006792 [Naganishia cerealis]
MGDHQSDPAGEVPVISLPTDLYLPILDNVEDKSLLAKVCLVDRLFLEMAREELYDFVWVRPWESGADPKFRLLFRTLNENAQIAELVHKLDIRYYPLASGIVTWEDFCVRALRNMTNLESVTWTRNKTLRSSMLEAIASLKSLTKLEINGNSKWAYDPILLNNLERLQELRIILPDRKVAENLKTLLKSRSESLQGDGEGNIITRKSGLQVLELISQDSRWVNDQLMQDVAPYLGNLRVFKLWGCVHIGPRGYFQVLRAAQDTLEELALEGVGWGDELDLLDEALDLAVISEQLPMLDTLMLRMSESRKDPKWIATYLARMPKLRVFHLQTSERRPEEEVYSMADLTTLAEHCGDNLAQIGWANRVYHVRRRKVMIKSETVAHSGQLRQRGWRQFGNDWEQVMEIEEQEEVYLDPWQAGTGSIPEVFQVWRA